MKYLLILLFSVGAFAESKYYVTGDRRDDGCFFVVKRNKPPASYRKAFNTWQDGCALEDTGSDIRFNQSMKDASDAAKQAKVQAINARQTKIRNARIKLRTECKNYGDLWNNDRTKWHECNATAWKLLGHDL